MLSLDAIFEHLPAYEATEKTVRLVRNGNVLSGKDIREAAGSLEDADNGARIRVYADGSLCGIYEYKIAGDIYKPYKMFLSP